MVILMSCKNCKMPSDVKTTHRSSEEKRKIIKRLNVIEGQVRGISQMIENDRYCDDVLIQISAVTKSLQSLGNTILQNHMKTCMIRDIQNGDTNIVDDVMKLVKKLQ